MIDYEKEYLKHIDKANEPSIDYDKVYTYTDYLKLEIDEMVEIIRGKLFRMSPAPRTAHQTISSNILTIFLPLLKGKLCKVFHAPIDVVLTVNNMKAKKSTTIVQPDICVVCDPSIIKDKAIMGVPDFIIEIVSASSLKKDTQLKFSVYEEAGVGEYWIVFAEMHCVEVFVLENGKYKRINTFSEDDVVPVHTLTGLEISIDDIFEGL